MPEATLAGRMAQWAQSLRFEALPPDVVDAAARHTADSLACAIASYHTEAVSILRRYALARGSHEEATLLGTARRVDARLAGLVGGTMVRYLDANDIYFPPPGSNRSGAHFSDIIPGVLAVAERARATGPEFLTAVVAAYEIQAVLCEAFDWMGRGIHSLTQVSFALPVVAGTLMKLDQQAIEWAAGLSGSTHLVLNSWLRPTSTIPMIKGGAPGLAAERAIEATDLAAAGFTAPEDALETLMKIMDGVSPAELHQRIDRLGHDWTVTRNIMKAAPCQIFTQAPVQTALDLHRRVSDPSRIASVVVYGNSGACAGVQGSDGAYQPESREAADHSTPYVVATALLTGSMTERAYEGERWRDPDMRAFMRKIRLVVDPERERGFRERGDLGCWTVVKLDDGSTYEAGLRQPRGHWENPFDGESLLAKMRDLLDDRFGRDFAAFLLAACRDLRQLPALSGLLDACRVE